MDGERDGLKVRTLSAADLAAAGPHGPGDHRPEPHGLVRRQVAARARGLGPEDLARCRGGRLLVGAVLGSLQYGEFGQPEPIAVLDTILVDPGLPRRGVGTALLEQLSRTRALGIERLRTEVAWDEHAPGRFLGPRASSRRRGSSWSCGSARRGPDLCGASSLRLSVRAGSSGFSGRGDPTLPGRAARRCPDRARAPP